MIIQRRHSLGDKMSGFSLKSAIRVPAKFEIEFISKCQISQLLLHANDVSILDMKGASLHYQTTVKRRYKYKQASSSLNVYKATTPFIISHYRWNGLDWMQL